MVRSGFTLCSFVSPEKTRLFAFFPRVGVPAMLYFRHSVDCCPFLPLHPRSSCAGPKLLEKAAVRRGSILKRLREASVAVECTPFLDPIFQLLGISTFSCKSLCETRRLLFKACHVPCFIRCLVRSLVFGWPFVANRHDRGDGRNLACPVARTLDLPS